MAPVRKGGATERIDLSATAQNVTPASGAEQPMKWKKYLKLKRQKDMKGFPKKVGQGIQKRADGDDASNKRDNKLLPNGVPRKVTDEEKALHETGASQFNPTAMRGGKIIQQKFANMKDKFEKRVVQTANASKRLREEGGYIESEDQQLSYTVRQKEIAESADLASAAKFFELKLPKFGPYHIDYTDNGRYLALGGRRGHVAALDWQTKSLRSENNVMESVNDIKFLHTENYIAVGQKRYTYIYDGVGTELHCIKQMHDVCKLDFLPFHFLLVASTRNSFLHWLDVSVGKMVTSFATKSGPLDVMCTNPANAIVHTGQTDGTVALWSPNVQEPLVKLLAHKSGLKGIAVDDSGKYMVTTGLDKKCRIWDVRMYRQLHAYNLPYGAANVAVSQKLNVACAVGNYVQVFRGMTNGTCKEPFLVHNCGGTVTDVKFVPWEDVLGIGHANGFTSMLVPGSGEANVDMMRSNPYETKSQRKEREVKQLLDKIQPELITLDPQDINKVNEGLLEMEEEARKKILFVRPAKVEYTPRFKMRGRGGGSHKEARKQIVRADIRVAQNKEKEAMEKEVFGRGEHKEQEAKHVLDRFRK